MPDSYSLHTHTCGELRNNNIGETVTLTGWVWHRRDHGGLIFIDLRDRKGMTQISFDPEHSGGTAFHTAERVRLEWPIMVTGTVRKRPEGMENARIETGEVEVLVSEIQVLNTAQTPPFQIEDRVDTSEDVRLRYRYLDLRRPKMAATRSRPRPSSSPRPRARATSSCPAARSRATSTPCPSPRSS